MIVRSALLACLAISSVHAVTRTETFRPSLDVNIARQNHAAVLLPDGRVLITGGYNADLATEQSAELYDPVLGVWKLTSSPMRQARALHASILLRDGRVLIAGGTLGFFDSAPLSSSELYDPVTDSFEQVGPMALPRLRPRATLLADGRVMMLGGSGSAGLRTQVEIFDPKTKSWSAGGSFPGSADVDQTVSLLPSGDVLVCGGTNSANGMLSQEVFRYSPLANTWQTMMPMATARAGHTSSTLPNGRLLLVSAASTFPLNQQYRSFLVYGSGSYEVYDPYSGINGRSIVSGSLGALPGYSVAALGTGRIVLSGGFFDVTNAFGIPVGMASTAAAVVFDPVTYMWSNTGSMSTGRAGHTMTVLRSGAILAVGGQAFYWPFPFLQHAANSSVDSWNTPPPSGCGNVVDVYKGVPARYNGAVHGSLNSCGNRGRKAADGYEWQCVEFIRRFYRLAKGCVGGSCDSTSWSGKGDAKTYYDKAVSFGLLRFTNASGPDANKPDAPATEPPRIDDILVFCKVNTVGGPCLASKVGHVAIVKDIIDTAGMTGLHVIEQNWDISGASSLEDITFLPVAYNSDGTYSVNPRGKYVVRGWLRKP